VGDTAGGTISAHWNGHAWALVPTPKLNDGSAPQNFLTGVTAAAANNVWASGYEGNANQQNFAVPYVLHFNGMAWSLVPSLDPGDVPPLADSTFAAVASAPPRTLFAVGTQELPTGCCLLALAERTTGG
jgi:hypothetical protein